MQKRTLAVLSAIIGLGAGVAAIEILHTQSNVTLENIVAYLDKRHDVVTAGTAILALLVSSVSIIFAACSMAMQRAHNRKSVLPLGHITVGDYEDDIFVRLRNDGIGPMVIEKMFVTKEGDTDVKESIIDHMPDEVVWTTFVQSLSGRAISPEKDVTLIRLQGNVRNPKFAKEKRIVRKALSNLCVKVEYKNIYGESMPPVSRSLNWFAR